MNLLKTVALAMLLSAPALAVTPITLETAYQEKFFSISTTGVTSITIDLGGFGAQGYAVPGGTYLANGVDGTTYGQSITISSATPNVTGFSYSALPLGGSVNLQIVQTIKTPPPAGANVKNPSAFNSPAPTATYFTSPVISTSSVIAIPANGLSDTFQAVVTNPIYIFTGLTAGATLFFSADYGVRTAQ